MRGHLYLKLQNLFRQTVCQVEQTLSFGHPRGATAVEYAIMVLLIAVVIIAAVAAVGQTLSGMFSSILKGFQ
jgi:Flp pilus assembly pilin Flp